MTIRTSWNWSAIFFVSVLGHVLVLKTFWFHDDWFFLANAARILNLDKGGSRWLSYVGYWKLLYPIFGLNPFFWGLSRLFFHAGASWLVAKIGRDFGLGQKAGLLSGLLFAGSPVVFESVYWGTGVIEILGVFFALASIDQWFNGKQHGIIKATLLGIIAIGCKEVGMLLPLLFLAHLLFSHQTTRVGWTSVLLLFFGAVISGLLLIVNLEGASDYSLALSSIPNNFFILGFWLIAPPQFQTGNEIGLSWAIFSGGVFWVLWLSLALLKLRKGGGAVSLWAWIICILALVPVLPLGAHIVPRYNYGSMAAVAIGLVYLIREFVEKWNFRYLWYFSLLMAVLTWWGTYYRINAKYPGGRSIHRLVVKEKISRTTCTRLEVLDLKNPDRLIFFLEPTGDPGELLYLQEALGGLLGPKLILGNGVDIKWSSKLLPTDIGAFVVSVNGLDLEAMGRYRPK